MRTLPPGGVLDQYIVRRQATVASGLRLRPPLLRAPLSLQRMANEKEAALAAQRFLELTEEEMKLLGKINHALTKFSVQPGKELFEGADELIQTSRKRIELINAAHASIVQEYEAALPKVREAFVQEYFGKLPKDFGKGPFEPEGAEDKPTYDAAWLQSLFDTLLLKTVPEPMSKEEEDEKKESEVEDIEDIERQKKLEEERKKEREEEGNRKSFYRHRYLAYALQGLRDPIGANQIRELLLLLGKDRKIVVAEGVRTDMSAGPVNVEDNEKATKLDSGSPEDDAAIMDEVGGDLFLFMRLKYGKGLDRKANPKASEIGDLQVNLDKEHYLFPIFAGLSGKQVMLFTTPKFMSVHHENGHLISMLKGKAGLGGQHKYKEALAQLTSQEEAYNIFGSPRSDRAYSESFGLPVRFDHKTLITYMEGASSWEDWAKLLEQSEKATYGALPSLQTKVASDLSNLLAADWSAKTKHVSKPKGFGVISSAMQKQKNAFGQLAAAQKEAAAAAKRTSKNRDALTQKLYDLVAGLDPSRYSSLKEVEAGLKEIRDGLK